MPNDSHFHAESRMLRAFRALGAVLGLLFLGGCSGEAPTSVTPLIGDHSAPVVAIRKIAPPGDSVLAFAVDAHDDLGLKTVRVRLVGGVNSALHTTFTSAVTTITLPYNVLVAH